MDKIYTTYNNIISLLNTSLINQGAPSYVLQAHAGTVMFCSCHR